MKAMKYSVAAGFENLDLVGDLEWKEDEGMEAWLERIGVTARPNITDGLSSEIRNDDYGNTVRIHLAKSSDSPWFAMVDVNDPEGVYQLIFCATPVDLFRLRMELLPFYALTAYRSLDDALYNMTRAIDRVLHIWHGHGLERPCSECDPVQFRLEREQDAAWKARRAAAKEKKTEDGSSS